MRGTFDNPHSGGLFVIEIRELEGKGFESLGDLGKSLAGRGKFELVSHVGVSFVDHGFLCGFLGLAFE